MRLRIPLPLLLAFPVILVACNPSLQPPSAHHSELHDDLHSRLRELFAITEAPGSPGVTRPYLSNASAVLRDALFDMMVRSHLQPSQDPVGNIYGRLSCPSSSSSSPSLPSRPQLLLGSHVDTVPSAGMWDGVYGVLASIAVAQILSARICLLPFDLVVIAFEDEEGVSPYGVTNLGARAFSSSLNVSEHILHPHPLQQRLNHLLISADVQLDLDTRVRQSYFDVAANKVVAFLELHIEQGPVLQQRRRPVGVVSAIAGQTRMHVRWTGVRGHAGTVPMSGRKDALVAASQAVLVVERVASHLSDQSDAHVVVATVGKVDIDSAGSNVIPGFVTMSVDIRSGDDVLRQTAVHDIQSSFREIASDRNVKVSMDVPHDVSAVPMTPWVAEVLDDVLDVRPEDRLLSGAGHDTQFVARVADVGMLFVRCRDGISHSPDEHVDPDDAYRGAHALLRAVEAIADKMARD